MSHVPLNRRLVAEFVGTGALLATVVGSGVMGENLADGNDALALLGNTLATGAILIVLIQIFSPISGAHFNPAVTVSFACQREMGWGESGAYIGAQILGGLIGVALAHIMFDLPVLMFSTKTRTGVGQWVAEAVAAFGLVATILGCLKARPSWVAVAVGLYISAGYWFTASTSFANPAVTLGRAFTETFTGIRLTDVPMFVAAQLIGAVAATVFIRWLWRGAPTVVDDNE